MSTIAIDNKLLQPKDPSVANLRQQTNLNEFEIIIQNEFNPSAIEKLSAICSKSQQLKSIFRITGFSSEFEVF